MNLAPYTPSADEWTGYFKEPNNSHSRVSFYKVKRNSTASYRSLNQTGGKKASVKIVSPTTQAVEQAKSDIKDMKDGAQSGSGIKRAHKNKNSSTVKKSGTVHKAKKPRKQKKHTFQVKDILSFK